MSVQYLLGSGRPRASRSLSFEPRSHGDWRKAGNEQAFNPSAYREMTRSSPFSVRGRRALTVMRDEREISIVRRQLNRLGMTVSEHDPAATPPLNPTVQVILMESEPIPFNADYAT